MDPECPQLSLSVRQTSEMETTMTAIDSKRKKQERIQEVQELIGKFGKNFLTKDLTNYCYKIWEELGRKRTIDITRGQKEIWASAVVLVIARLNFLFDKKNNKNYISMDSVYEYYGTKRGSVGLRAAEIEKACKISIGHEGLCSESISDELTFVELPNGMVLTKAMAKKAGII